MESRRGQDRTSVLAPFVFRAVALLEQRNNEDNAMRRQIRVRGEQRDALELERLAHALLRAARELAETPKVAKPPTSALAQPEARGE